MATSDARPTPPPVRFGGWVAVGGLVVVAAWLLGPHWEGTWAVDRDVAHRFGTLAATHDGWRNLWVVVSDVLTPTTWRVLALVGGLAAVTGRHTGPALNRSSVVWVGWSAMVLLGGLIPVVLKQVVGRPRPPWASVEALGLSFPSGHAFGATVFCAGVWLLLLDHRGGALTSRARRWVATLGVVVVIVVCFARVALAVHYVTDVAAGVGLGLAYAGGWAWLVAVLDRRVAARRC